MQGYAHLLLFAFALTVFSCSANQNEKQLAPAADMLVQNISSSAAVTGTKDSGRHFLRTADIKFKVKDVAAATYGIENIVSRHGGFIRYTNLASQVNDKAVIRLSPDSSMELTRYAVTNTITLSVPNNRLDTTLKELPVHIDYLDYRVIKAEDVSLQLLANSLETKRSEKFQQRLEDGVVRNRKKLAETTEAEHRLMVARQAEDEAKLASLDLNDRINFSTVTIDIYQNEGVLRRMVAYEKELPAYQPGFIAALKDSALQGWLIVEYILLIVVRFWALILIGIAGYIVYKKYAAMGRWVHPKN